MKTFLIVLILIFSFQSWTKADDIRDFEIEGISVGDSILKHYDKELISKRKETWPKSNKYTRFWDNNFNSEIYESLQLIYLTNDKDYIIRGISFGIFYENKNISECYNKQNEIKEELKPLFANTKIVIGEITKHRTDVTGKSIFKNIYFRFTNGDTVAIGCYDWSKTIEDERGWVDHLRIAVYDNDHKIFLQGPAYN